MQKRSNRKKKNFIYSIIDSSSEETIINVFGVDGLFTGATEREAIVRAIEWIADEERMEERNISVTKKPVP